MKDNEDLQDLQNSKKEAKWTLFVYLIYFLWSIISAYWLGSKNPYEYNYILGFPSWFFYSCILSYPLACIAVYILTRFFFKNKEEIIDNE